MSRRWLIVLLSALILLAVGIGLYFWLTPRLVAFTPATQASNIPAGATIELVFSRPLDQASLVEHFSTQPAQSGAFTQDGNRYTFTPDKPWPNNTVIQVRLQAGSHAAAFPQLPVRQEQSWSFTTGSPRLAYLYPFEGAAQIYTLDLDTGEIDQLSQAPGEVLDYSVSHTGVAIYYCANQGGESSAIYRLNRLSGETETLLELPGAMCRYLDISPFDDYLAYERTDLYQASQPSLVQVWLLPLSAAAQSAGTVEPFLAGEPDQPGEQPHWSPDGKLTYHNPTNKTFVIQDVRSGEQVLIPSQTGQSGDWSPDGQRYVFAEILLSEATTSGLLDNLTPIPSSHLLLFHPADGYLVDLTQLDNLEDTSPVFSPDGSRLAFARKYLNQADWTPGRQLWVMNLSDKNVQPLSDDPQYNHYSLAWSPSGEQIACVRFDQTVITQPPELWLLDAGGIQATLLIRGGYTPKWIP